VNDHATSELLEASVIGSTDEEELARARTPPETPVLHLLVALIVFPPTGLVALFYQSRAYLLRDKALAQPGGGNRATMLRYAAKAREWGLISLGVGLTIYVVTFLVSIFVVNDFAVTKDYLNPVYLERSLPGIVRAFGQNLVLSVVAYATSVMWGLVLAIARGLPGPAAAPVRAMAVIYIDVFRGLPSLLTILIIGFGLPQTGIPFFSGLDLFASGVLALTVFFGAYMAEVFRSGIESVHASQVAAARSIGLSYVQTMRHVVLPQAISRMLPSLLSWYIAILKDTSLLSVLGLLEAVNVSRIMITNQSNLSALTGIALCYLVVTIPLSRLTDHLVRRSEQRRSGGS
jgi:polar amino acid transport system permease protein